MSIVDFDESSIINNVKQGNIQAFNALITKYQSNVFRTCMGFVHNREDADDLTQETFIQAYQALHTFKNESRFSNWLYRIAVNLSLNYLRKANRKLIFKPINSLFGSDKNTEPELQVPDLDDPEKIFLGGELKQHVQKALDKLPEKQRTAIILSKYDELSQKEIAEIMEINEGAVESLIQRAKAGLRDSLWQIKYKK